MTIKNSGLATVVVLQSPSSLSQSRSSSGISSGRSRAGGFPPMMTATRSALLVMMVVGRATGETLAAGGNHVCVVTTTGGVKCWGYNSEGQLGYGDTDKRGASTDTLGAELNDVDLGTGRTAVSVTAGDQHTCAVLDDGSLKCWGYGNNGQLGQGNTTSHGDTADTMGDSLAPVDLGTLSTGGVRKAVKAVAGTEFTCVLTEDGQVACFGRNDYGEVGVGRSGDIGKVPADMGDGLEMVDFGAFLNGSAVDISSGPCALFGEGSVKCWGNNLYGSTGVPGSVDVGLDTGDMGDALPAVPLGSAEGQSLAATLVTSGHRHNCAVFGGAASGQVKCWGKNTQGNLGLGYVHDLGNDDDELGDSLSFTDLGLSASVSRIDGGLDHTCALLTDGSVKCWGKNYFGALGLGDYKTRGYGASQMGTALPTVFLGDNRTAVDVSCGQDFSCAVLDDGGVKCWGDGAQGKLGQGNSQQLGDEPLEMESLSAVDLGSGVLVAAPAASLTFAPTSAPTSSPTFATTVTPLGSIMPLVEPSSTGPPDGSLRVTPSPETGGDRSVDGEGPLTSGSDGNSLETASESTSDGSSSSTWKKTAVYFAAPAVAIALMAGAFVAYKRRSGRSDSYS